MLVQIPIAEQNIAIRRKLGVPPRPSRFLDVIFQGIGDIIVDHQPNILFIHPHAKGGGGYHNPHLPPEEGLLIFHLLQGVHPAVEVPGREPVAGELPGQLLGPPGPGGVDDGGAIFLLHQGAKGAVLLLLCLPVQDGIAQILPRRGGGEKLQLQPQLFLEVIPNITDNLLLCRGGEAGNRNGALPLLLLLKLPDKIPNIQVIHPEVLPPGGKAVSLVNDEAHHVAGKKQLFDGAGAQLLRRKVEEAGKAAFHPVDGIRPFNGAKKPVYRHRVHQAPLAKVIYLVLHKGLQRGDDHRKAVLRLARHQGRKLEGDGLAAAGGKDRQKGAALHRRLGRPLLERLPAIGAKARKAEEFPELFMNIQGVPAVIAAGLAGGIAKMVNHPLHPGVVVQHPGRRDGVPVPLPDEGQGIGQLQGELLHQDTEVQALAEPPGKLLADSLRQVRQGGGTAEVIKEAPELLAGVEQPAVDGLPPWGKGPKGVHLVIKQLLGLEGVV